MEVLDGATPEEIQAIDLFFKSGGGQHFWMLPAVYKHMTGVGGLMVDRKEFLNWKIKHREAEMAVRKAVAGPAQVDIPKSAPNCPTHNVQMRFNPESGVFGCPDRDCDMQARPRNTKANLRDVVLTGIIELVKKGDKFFILLAEENVLIDVSEIVEEDGTGEIHSEEGMFSLMLRFKGMRELPAEE